MSMAQENIKEEDITAALQAAERMDAVSEIEAVDYYMQNYNKKEN